MSDDIIWKGPDSPKPAKNAVWNFLHGWMVPVSNVAAEREACAKIADSKLKYDPSPHAEAMAAHIAAAIRARGTVSFPD